MTAYIPIAVLILFTALLVFGSFQSRHALAHPDQVVHRGVPAILGLLWFMCVLLWLLAASRML